MMNQIRIHPWRCHSRFSQAISRIDLSDFSEYDPDFEREDSADWPYFSTLVMFETELYSERRLVSSVKKSAGILASQDKKAYEVLITWAVKVSIDFKNTN